LIQSLSKRRTPCARPNRAKIRLKSRGVVDIKIFVNITMSFH
jgi:hypothetical protein